MEFEYLFFDEAIARRFCEACVRETGLEPQLKETDGQWLAQLPESVSDTHMDTVEALYETFFSVSRRSRSRLPKRIIRRRACRSSLPTGVSPRWWWSLSS